MRLADSILTTLLVLMSGTEGFTLRRASNTFLNPFSQQRRQRVSSVAAVPEVASFLSDPFLTVSSAMPTVATSPEPIHSAFSVATFLPQPFWLLIILFPKQKITKQIMGGLGTRIELASRRRH